MRVAALKSVVQSRLRGPALVAVASIVAVTGGVLAPTDSGAVAPAEVPTRAVESEVAGAGFQVQLGREQRLIGPSGEIDVPYFSERSGSGELMGYAGTSRTKVWKTRNNTRLSKPRLILDRGRTGAWDECGRWLMSIQKFPGRWVGYYHAENKGVGEDTCDHISDTTVWRMGTAVSTNNGQTWTVPGYPDNVVLSGTGTTASTGGRHAGNGRVVRVGEYLYMLFQVSHGNHPELPGVHIARATVASQGLGANAWKKYYCHPATLTQPAYCAFDEPGIGGKSTPMDKLGEKARYVSYNTYLNRWIGFDASGRRGFKLFASQTPGEAGGQDLALRKWLGSTDIYPPVSTADDKRVDQWGGSTRSQQSRQLYAYPSILGSGGESSTSGQSFYVYYMKLFPGEKFNARYLFRRKVTLKASNKTLHRVELTTYKDKRSGKRRTSTEAPQSKRFRATEVTGYLLARSAPGWKQAFECKRRSDYAVFVNRCARGWNPSRRIGWLKPKRTRATKVAIYRCFDKGKGSHFVSTSRRCGGAKNEAKLGYVLKGL